MKNLKTRDIVYLWIIVLSFLGLTFLLSNTMYLYGSQLDWYSEHITIPDYFRTLFYNTKDFLPDFAANIGSGQNIYNFSYYGFLSPIILPSYLMPNVKMTTYIMASTIITVIASAILLYIFLKNKKFSSETCFISSLMFAFSACMSLHSHRHIMFISYMPFLILGLFGVDKKLNHNKGWLLSLSVFLMIMTNYYFSIGGILMLVIYGIYSYLKDTKKITFKMFLTKGINFVLPIIIGILSASIIILPTLASLLNNRAESNIHISIWDLIIPNINTEYALYDSYGLGLTAIIFPAIICFFKKKKENIFLGIVLSLFIIFPIFNWILNGTMYIDAKSLIPFLALYIYVIADFVESIINHDKINFKLLIPLLLVIVLISYLNDHRLIIVVADLLILFVGMILYNKFNKKALLIIPLIISTFVASYAINASDNLVLKYTAKQNESEIKDRINNITKNDDSFYRISNDNDVSENTNRIYQNINYYNSTIYSSISNQKYNHFYFDVINNNISSRNRALTITTGNIFSLLLTNNKYVISRNKPLQGYELVETDSGINVYKNEDVLPLGFATNNVMSYDDFSKISYAAQMETLMNVIVADTKTNNSFVPSVKKTDLDFDTILKNEKITKEKDGTYTIKTKDSLKITYDLPEKYHNKILIIRFKMNHEQTCGEGDQVIVINNIKNKLTCKSWKYHNKNFIFDYVLAEKDLKKLTISFQDGEYNIGDIESYSLDYSNIERINKKVDSFNVDTTKTKGDKIIGDINVKEDGYFMLTIPYDEGFNIKVDGQKTNYEIVDDAFIGFKISKGKHEIEIEYKAPFKELSIIVSLLGIITFIVVTIIETKRKI